MQVICERCTLTFFPHKKDMKTEGIYPDIWFWPAQNQSVCVRVESGNRVSVPETSAVCLACHWAQESTSSCRHFVFVSGLVSTLLPHHSASAELGTSALKTTQPFTIAQATTSSFPFCRCFLIYKSLPWPLPGSNYNLCILWQDITRPSLTEFHHQTVTDQPFPLGYATLKNWSSRTGKI